MLEFTAIDFETANRYADSACSLTAVSIAGQAVMHEGYTLIKPPFNRFDEDNIRIHGITPQMVSAKPTFDALWPDIRERLNKRILIAHYAVFDTRVLRSLIKRYNLPGLDASYACTVEISRKVWPDLPNHKLDTVADHLGFTFRHHQALDDARACARIVCAAAERTGASSVEDLLTRTGLKLKHF